MDEDDSRYISADGPANLRHLRREQAALAPVNDAALARVQRAHARHLLGAPLQAQMQAAGPSKQPPIRPVQIGSAVACAVGAVLLLLGAIQASLALAGTGAGLLAGGAAALVWLSRGSATTRAIGSASPLFDDESLNRFDAALDLASTELSEPLCQQLLGLKGSLARIGSRAATASTDEHFTLDDRMYLVQCLRRYIPDSLEAYLRVPATQRNLAAVGQGETPEAILARQLSMLQAEVERREEALGRSAAEGLRRQQRFLESKRRG
jgi:hypothetical protein